MHKKTYRGLLKGSTLLLIISVAVNVGFVRRIIQLKLTQQAMVEKESDETEKRLMISRKALEERLYNEYNTTVLDAFTKEELANAMQRQWKYIISINSQELKSNRAYIPAGNIRIMVAEVIKKKSTLSQEILQLGCLDKSIENMCLTDLIEVYSTVGYIIEREENEEGIKYYYNFRNVPKETLITLKLSPLLTDKLEFKDKIKENQIALIVKEQP